MSKKGHKDKGAAAKRPSGAKRGAVSQDLAADKTVPGHGSVAVAGEQALLSRAGDADSPKQVADLRQDPAEKRRGTASLPFGMVDRRKMTAGRREEIANLGEGMADQREVAAIVKAAFDENTHVQVREANRRLIAATIHAKTMTKAAELAIQQMWYMAEHDVLTGLPNRALLADRLSQSIALAQRHGKKIALMYLDLDHFKHVNDSLGHSVGDQLLQSVAKRLQASVRLSDTVSRQGGDEFVVLLNEIDEVQDAVLIAKKILAAMAPPHFIGDNQLHVTVSIGISIYPDDGSDVETLLRNADTAMYQTKKTGRNHCHLYRPEMNVEAVARQTVVQALHLALEEGRFVLHYQPKVNLDTGAITGSEALVRMQESDNQVVSPENFIAVAEECGLILQIGRWVLHEACRQTQAWLQAGLDIGQVAVNVSSREFHSKDFFDRVISILDATGLDPSHLELEMTESGLMLDTEPTTVLLSALKKLGIQLAIDDFGTGYSSLSYLLRFPIDTLKIDKSFVQGLEKDPGGSGEAIVNAVIGMGTSLQQRVVAEGIETREQLAFLQSHRCVEGQGYYFSRPVPANEFAALLKKTALNQHAWFNSSSSSHRNAP